MEEKISNLQIVIAELTKENIVFKKCTM